MKHTTQPTQHKTKSATCYMLHATCSSKLNPRKGFSLLELIIVFGIIALLAGITAGVFRGVRDVEVLDNNVTKIISLFEEARNLTIASEDSSQYGVYATTTFVTLFKGVVYSEVSSDNRVFNFNPLVTITNINLTDSGYSVVFKRLSGEVEQSGSIEITFLGKNSASTTIDILKTGIVNITE